MQNNRTLPPTRESKLHRKREENKQNPTLTPAQRQQLGNRMKAEILIPIIERTVAHGESLELARAVQRKFETRGVIKYLIVSRQDWVQPAREPLLRSLWCTPAVGQLGYLSSDGQLYSHELATGSPASPLSLSSLPPFQKSTMLAAVCSPHDSRVFTLNRNWVLEVWHLLQGPHSLLKRLQVLSTPLVHSLEKYYSDGKRGLFPHLLAVTPGEKLVVNASCVDGCFYFYDSASLTFIFKVPLTLDELLSPVAVQKALDLFAMYLNECDRIGISQERAFELMDTNRNGELSFEELNNTVKQLQLKLTDVQIRGMFDAMDADCTGSVNLNEFWGALHMRKQNLLAKEKENVLKLSVPQWVTNIRADERAKRTLHKLFTVLEEKAYTPARMFEVFDHDGSGIISRGEFKRTLEELLFPMIDPSDIMLLERIADRDGNGRINYMEFWQLLNLRGTQSTDVERVDSSRYFKDSLMYVLNKSVELGIDLYRKCMELDEEGGGTMSRESFCSLLLREPLGLSMGVIESLIDREILFDDSGNVNYQGIFESAEYNNLLKISGAQFEQTRVNVKMAVIEDFAFIDDLNSLAYTCRNPETSVIFIKDIQGQLLAKCVGHWNQSPPIIKYIQNANALVSAERREYQPTPLNVDTCCLPTCEILVWNLQKDLIDKFQVSPPWVVKPYRRIKAHEGSIIDMTYLEIAQVIVTTGSDGILKVWDPTGTPYKLNEVNEYTDVSYIPGQNKPVQTQHTLSNTMFSLVHTIKFAGVIPYRVLGVTFKEFEWLIILNLRDSEDTGTIEAWGIHRFRLNVPAFSHDKKVPNSVVNEAKSMFEERRTEKIEKFKHGLASQLDSFKQQDSLTVKFYNDLKKSIIHSVLLESRYDEIFKLIVRSPNCKESRRQAICPEEMYAALNGLGLIRGYSFPMYLKLLATIHRQLTFTAASKPVDLLELAVLSDLVLSGHVSIAEVLPTEVVGSSEVNIKNSLMRLANYSEHDAEKITSQLSRYSSRDLRSYIERQQQKIQPIDREIFERLAKSMTENGVSVYKMFTEIDTNKNRSLSRDEFCQFMKSIRYPLSEIEIDCVMKKLDVNVDQSVSYRELKQRLEASGYNEPVGVGSMQYQWEDQGIVYFFNKFKEQTEYKTYFELFDSFDYNRDGQVDPQEFQKTLHSITPSASERIMNMILAVNNHSFDKEVLVKTLEKIEQELPRNGQWIPSKNTMEHALKKHNILQMIQSTVDDLVKNIESFSQMSLPLRGLNLYSIQCNTQKNADSLASLSQRFNYLLEYISAFCLSTVHNHSFSRLIDPVCNKFLCAPYQPTREIPSILHTQFKLISDTQRSFNSMIKYCLAKETTTNEQLKVSIYTPESFRCSFDKYLSDQLQIHLNIQETHLGIVKFLGKYEKRVGVEPSDKEIFVFYSKDPDILLQEVLRKSGGLFNIPIFHNTKTSIYLAKYYAMQVLHLLGSIHSYSAALRFFDLKSFHLSPDGLNLKLNSLKALGITDTAGNVISAPALSQCLKSGINMSTDPFIAPEFLLEEKETAAADVWCFGILLYSILFGKPPPSYFTALTEWSSGPVPALPIKPPSHFTYNVFKNTRIQGGKFTENPNKETGVLTTLCHLSYSGLVDDTQDLSKLKGKIMQKDLKLNEYGALLDLVALCLQPDPANRPTIQGLLHSPALKLTDYETSQAEKCAVLMLQVSSPSLNISQSLIIPLQAISSNFSILHSGRIEELIKLTYFSIRDTRDYFSGTRTAKSRSVSDSEKKTLLGQAIDSPNSDTVKQAIHEKTLDILVTLSLRCFKQGHSRPLVALIELLTNITYEMISYVSTFAPYVSTLLESILKVFVGEESHLASFPAPESSKSPYVLRLTYWTPKLFELTEPLYKDIFTESGTAQDYYPVIQDAIESTRHPDYFSELIMLAQNITILKKPETGAVARKNVLRHIRSMLLTNNEHKNKAALDFRLPQQLFHSLQDPDATVRAEAALIMYDFSRSCQEEESSSMLNINSYHRHNSMINFFTVAKSETKETTKSFAQYAGLIEQPLSTARRGIARCFENAVYVCPLVKLLKSKAEPFDTREIAAKTLINVLKGNECMIRAVAAPATDGLLALAKSLFATFKPPGNRPVKALAPILRQDLESLLENAPPVLVKLLTRTAGAESSLRDHNLHIPPIITLPLLMQGLPSAISNDTDLSKSAVQLKNWLSFVYQKSKIPTETAKLAVERVLTVCKEAVDHFWLPAEQTLLSRTELSIETRSHAQQQISIVFDLIELENLRWLIDKSSQALESSGTSFEIYPLEYQGAQCVRVIAQFMRQPDSGPILASLYWGEIYQRQLTLQFYRVQSIVEQNTESLHMLKLYASQSEARLSIFKLLLESPVLQQQFLQTEFIEKLVVEFLNDRKILDAKYSQLSLDFLAFRECMPVRGEAIAMIQTLFESREGAGAMYDDLILHFMRHKVIETELLLLESENHVIQATACLLLELVVTAGDPQLEYLLLQSTAHAPISRALERCPMLRLRFPCLQEYSSNFP